MDLSTIKGIVTIIPAAGVGQRMRSETPKQYLTIGKKLILDITLEKFLSFDPVELIIVAVSANDRYVNDLVNINDNRIVLIEGGDERVNSVNNALHFLFDNGLSDKAAVMVHDAARPCITHEDLKRLQLSFIKDKQACFLAAAVVNTLHRIDEQKQAYSTVSRDQLVNAMTPQMACFIDLKRSLETAVEEKKPVTDEMSALMQAGHKVNAVMGRADNIKITTPDDLALAEFYLSRLTV